MALYDHREKLKKKEKRDTRLDLDGEVKKKTVEYEGDSDTKDNLILWNNPKGTGKETEETEDSEKD